MLLHAALAAIEQNPKLKAAVLIGRDQPLKSAPTTEVKLYDTVKAASDEFKRLKELYEATGEGKPTWGSQKLGLYTFESGLILALDKKPRKVSA